MINVSNIERFATHDGPGIRTTVFIKGCPLHCPWCANPETWGIQPVLMHDERKCVRCQNCLKECKEDAISFQPQFTLDVSKCSVCGDCVDVCIPDALSLSGKKMSLDAIVKEVAKDDKYYETSNGGVTLSGGEPLYQFEKSFELIRLLKEKGYHIALETTGMYALDRLKQVEPYVDLFLHDVKHIDKTILHTVTGANLDTIFTNLEYLSKTCPEKVIVRVPVIPRFNDQKETLESIILFAKEKQFKEVNLLPYHPLGKNKWDNLKRDYIYRDDKMMDKECLSEYIEFGNANGIYVKVGG